MTTALLLDILDKHLKEAQTIYIAGWSSPVARRAHNPKVVGSNPAPATTLCDQKRYHTEKARNHAVSGLFSCPVLTAQKKDIFPPFTRVVRT